MILEIRKTCLETIQRALININQLRSMQYPRSDKKMFHKINSIQNQIQLLKDNFTLIIAKIVRMEGKCLDKQSHAHNVQAKYRQRYEEINQKYKIMEIRHQKQAKQLNFIKFSNKNLRKQIFHLESKAKNYQNMKKTLKNIEDLIAQNTENLQGKIHRIIGKTLISSSFSFQLPQLNPQVQFLSELRGEKQFYSQQKDNFYPKNISQKKQIPLSQSIEMFSQDLTPQTSSAKKKKLNQKQFINSLSLEKKKKGELAKLIQQQSRLAKIKQRYLSTDII